MKKRPFLLRKERFKWFLDIKYLSFHNTITACKKCAFNFDMNNMELCPTCKQHNKGIQYPICIQCLPEEKRKAALGKIEFGKEWHAMHKSLELIKYGCFIEKKMID